MITISYVLISILSGAMLSAYGNIDGYRPNPFLCAISGFMWPILVPLWLLTGVVEGLGTVLIRITKGDVDEE